MEHKNKTFNVLFWLRKGRVTDKVAPLYCRVTIQGQRYEISLNCKIKPQNWNSQAQRSVGKTIIDKDANCIIDNTRQLVNETISRILSKGYDLNVHNFRTMWLSGNFWLVSFKISYLCLPLFYETRTTPSCHPSGCAYRQL